MLVSRLTLAGDVAEEVIPQSSAPCEDSSDHVLNIRVIVKKAVRLHVAHRFFVVGSLLLLAASCEVLVYLLLGVALHEQILDGRSVGGGKKMLFTVIGCGSVTGDDLVLCDFAAVKLCL